MVVLIVWGSAVNQMPSPDWNVKKGRKLNFRPNDYLVILSHHDHGKRGHGTDSTGSLRRFERRCAAASRAMGTRYGLQLT